MLRFPAGERVLRGAGSRAIAMALACAGLLAAVPHAGAATPWRQESFLIGGWVPGFAQDGSRLARLNDAGFDYFHVNDPFPKFNRIVATRLDSLVAARPGFRLQYIASFKGPIEDPGRVNDNDDPVKNWPRIQESLSTGYGMNRPSTLGWLLSDEPGTDEKMARIGEMTRRLRANPATAGQIPYVNLFPALDPKTDGWYGRRFGMDPRAAYAAYLRTYLSLFDRDPDPAPVLSFDHYPFPARTKPKPLWFLTLAVARDETRARERPGKIIPVWAIIQSSDHKLRGQKTFSNTFTPVQLRWQAWSAVAYGVKGIAYWTLTAGYDPGADLGFAAGVFDDEGRPLPLLADVAALNRELHALGPTLMQLDPVGARHVSTAGQEGIEFERWTGTNPLGPIVGVDKGSGDADALVTLFRHRKTGEDWVFVFNKSLSTARTFRVRLARAPRRVDRLARTTGRPSPVSTGVASFSTGSLAAGTGDLFRLVPPGAD